MMISEPLVYSQDSGSQAITLRDTHLLSQKPLMVSSAWSFKGTGAMAGGRRRVGEHRKEAGPDDA